MPLRQVLFTVFFLLEDNVVYSDHRLVRHEPVRHDGESKVSMRVEAGADIETIGGRTHVSTIGKQMRLESAIDERGSVHFATIEGQVGQQKYAIKQDPSKCEEYDYPAKGTWQDDNDCCAVKPNARCKHGYTLKWLSKTCVEGHWGSAHLYECDVISSASADPSKCEEYGYPKANEWQRDPECCAMKPHGKCADGYTITWGGDCAKGNWGVAHSFTCTGSGPAPSPSDPVPSPPSPSPPDPSKCEEYGYPTPNVWQRDPECCAMKPHGQCADGYTITWGAECAKGNWGVAQSFTCTTGSSGPSPGPAPGPSPGPSGPSISLTVVSYNLWWWKAFGQEPSRGHRIVANIRDTLRPDVMGSQECDDPWKIANEAGLQVASYFKGAQGTFVKKGSATVLDKGDTDLHATGKWGPRYVTWAKLQMNGRVFYHFNTHWCVHSEGSKICNEDTRFRGAQHMVRKIKELTNNLDIPAIVTGDFNAFGGAQRRRRVAVEHGPNHFLQNGFQIAKDSYVDAIFYSQAHWTVGHNYVGDDGGSDHRPIVAELTLT